MTNLNLQITSEIAKYIKDDIIAKIPSEIDQLIPENVDKLINNIYVLRYYCSQRSLDFGLINRLDDIIETCQGLWELLDSNTSTFMYLREMYKIRRLDFFANLIGQYEETTSGEESFRDFVLESIATYLGWKSDTIWVDVAKIDHYAPIKNHVRKLRLEIWKLLDDMPKDGDQIDLAKAIEIGEKMDFLLNFIVGDETQPVGQALFLSTIYVLLLRLKLDRTISIIQSIGEGKNNEENR